MSMVRPAWQRVCGRRRCCPHQEERDDPHLPALQRISVLLDILLEHAPKFGKRMIVLDDGDDSWNVVLVDEHDGDEFLRLCEQLDMGTMEQDQWQ
ncbi:MAG TPA: hypothetical protein VF774_28025 [Pseudoduganella sp.]|jgi:hypothetical protein